MKRKILAFLLSAAIITSLFIASVKAVTPTWVYVSGYSNATTGSITETDGVTTFNGYGYGKYNGGSIGVVEGTSVSLTVAPQTVLATQQFAIAFLNTNDSFFSSKLESPMRDSGSGFAFVIRAFGTPSNGCGIYYSEVKSGIYTYNSDLGTTNHLIRNVAKDMAQSTYTLTVTRKTQTIDNANYTWEVTLTTNADSTVKTVLLTDAEVNPDCFANGMYLTAGVRTANTGVYNISGLTVTIPDALQALPANSVVTQVGKSVSVDVSKLFFAHNVGSVSYSTNIGTITGTTWSYTPSTVGKTTVTVTAEAGTKTEENSFSVSAVNNLATRIRGYESTAGTFTTSGDTLTLDGYGAVQYSYPISATEGSSVSFTIAPQAMVAGVQNIIGFALTNKAGSFYAGGTDTGSGFAFQLASWSQYTSGAGMHYTTLTNGVMGYPLDGKHLVKNCPGNMIGSTWKVTITKKSQTISNVAYTWEIILESNLVGTTTWRLTANEVPDSVFANGYAYLSMGYRLPSGVTYQNSNIIVDVKNFKSSVAATHALPVAGDINNDGTVDLFDLILYRKSLLGQESLTTYQKALADMQGTGGASLINILALKETLINYGTN